MLQSLQPDNTVFVVLSLEGPDIYSMAGGLGVRVTELSRALAQSGFETHLFFVGDPSKAGHEEAEGGRWKLHRWGQWLSAFYLGGVYQGEADKIRDFEKSLPPYLIDNIIAPAVASGKMVAILAEEWHTTGTVIMLHHYLKWQGLRDRCVIFWNANNTFGFDNIQWPTLQQACHVTTVSRYMKHKMWMMGVDPLVIPNGIPPRLLDMPPQEPVESLRRIVRGRPLLAKVGRFDPDKRWIMAIDAMAVMMRMGMKPLMLMRGGMEQHREDIRARAALHGLRWGVLQMEPRDTDHILWTLRRQIRDVDILELRFFVPEEFLRIIYAASDAVLANSGHEPFGLVGLEVMATGGIPFTGCTGEEYAHCFYNAIVIDSDDPREIAIYVSALRKGGNVVNDMRRNAHHTASHYTWHKIIRELLRKLEFAALVDGVLKKPRTSSLGGLGEAMPPGI